MHELSIACATLDAIAKALGGLRPFRRVGLTVGRLSGVSVEALRFCFGEVCKARDLGEPELRIEEPVAQAHCKACGADYALVDVFESCPRCGSIQRALSGGDELRVDYVEPLEEEDA